MDITDSRQPYATAIPEALEVPGLEVGLFWRTVHDTVVSATGGAQEPFTYGALPATAIYIHPPAPATVAHPVVSTARELAMWQSAQRNDAADAFRDYLKHSLERQFSTHAPTRRLLSQRLSGWPADGRRVPRSASWPRRPVPRQRGGRAAPPSASWLDPLFRARFPGPPPVRGLFKSSRLQAQLP
jgi:hypothetical protein